MELMGYNRLLPKLATIISKLASFAVEYKDMPTLGFVSFTFRLRLSILHTHTHEPAYKDMLWP
jgi:hypothetical protein